MINLEKIIYSFLKELENNETKTINGQEIIIPNSKTYEISKEAYGKLILKMEEEKLIRCSYAKSKGIPSIIFTAEITENGKQYLKDNSQLGKIYNGLKEIKSFL